MTEEASITTEDESLMPQESVRTEELGRFPPQELSRSSKGASL